MSGATEESNDKHMAPWSEACQRDGIVNTPLSPYVDKELLYNKHLCVDGSKIEATGFSYQEPRITIELLREVSQLFRYSCEVVVRPSAILCLLRWWMTILPADSSLPPSSLNLSKSDTVKSKKS